MRTFEVAQGRDRSERSGQIQDPFFRVVRALRGLARKPNHETRDRGKEENATGTIFWEGWPLFGALGEVVYLANPC